MDVRHKSSPFLRHALLVVFAVAPALAGVVALTPTGANAFAQGATATRIVQGKVVDKSGAALKGAIVYLKDSHTLAVKSAVSTDDGGYRFGQLAQNADYELWAEDAGKKSGTKNVSSFDSRKEFDFTLKIDK